MTRPGTTLRMSSGVACGRRTRSRSRIVSAEAAEVGAPASTLVSRTWWSSAGGGGGDGSVGLLGSAALRTAYATESPAKLTALNIRAPQDAYALKPFPLADAPG